MPSQPPLYLADSTGVIWLITVAPNGQLLGTETNLIPPPTYPSSFLLLDSANAPATPCWQVGIEPDGHLIQTPATALPTTQSTLLMFTPSGTAWNVSIYNGQLQTSAVATGIPCTTPLATLGVNVLERLEENPAGPIFWLLQPEVYVALEEAMNDYLLLVGRPTNTVSQPITLTPNIVWQTIPKGIFLITDLYGPQGEIRRTNLFSLDYIQPGSLTPSWENDTGPYPYRWGPVGFNLFFVHPAPQEAITVTMTGIAQPVAEAVWPPTGAETVPFHHEAFTAFELYAAHYCRLKEGGAEFQEGMGLFQEYLALAQKMSMIEDKRDRHIFARVPGAQATVSPITKR